MKRFLPLLFCLLTGFSVTSQTVDETFGPMMLTYGLPRNVSGTVPVAGGKTVVFGQFSYVNGRPVSSIARMNADGTVDETFGFKRGNERNAVQAVIPDASGKLLVIWMTIMNTHLHVAEILRLNIDGTIDSSFKPSFSTGETVLFAAIQSTGKIVVYGRSINMFGTDLKYFVRRLNADGSKDHTFHDAAPSDDLEVNCFKTLPDDKILIGGWFTAYSGSQVNNFVRLDADGTIDNSFQANIAAGVPTMINSFLLLPGGKLMVLQGDKIFRLNSDGSIDGTFASSGNGYNSMVVLTDGSVIAASNVKIFKFNAAGSLVKTIDVNDLEGSVYDLGNDRVLTGSHSTNPYVSHIARKSDLSIDDSWTPSMVLLIDFFETYFSKQPDGKWLIASSMEFYSTGDPQELYPNPGIFRLNADMSIDSTFTAGSHEEISKIMYVSEQGKIYVKQFIGSGYHIIRLNSNGYTDLTFTPVAGDYSDMDETDDGRFVAVTFDSKTKTGKLVRFDSNGSIDNSLNVTSVGRMNTVDAVPGGWYIYITEYEYDKGSGTYINGAKVKSITRMNSDGTIDFDFDLSSYIDELYSIKVVDGQIMAAGQFWKNETGAGFFPIERWDDTGAREFSINNTPYNGLDFTEDSDRIYMIGLATYGSSDYECQVVRLLSNGENDTTFAPITYRRGTSDIFDPLKPDRLFMLPDGSILIYADKFYHIELPSDSMRAPSDLTATAGEGVSLTWKDNSSKETGFEIERSYQGGVTFPDGFTIIGTVGPDVTTFTDPAPVDGNYNFYRVRAVTETQATAYSEVVEVEIVAGLTETETSFTVYPNPIRDHLQINSDAVVERFTLYQVDGRLVEEDRPQSRIFTINMSSYATGLYLLKIENSTSKKTLRIFKQ